MPMIQDQLNCQYIAILRAAGPLMRKRALYSQDEINIGAEGVDWNVLYEGHQLAGKRSDIRKTRYFRYLKGLSRRGIT
jgi:hypothetical protein